MKSANVQLCLVITFILFLTQTASATPITVERSFTPRIILGNPIYGHPAVTWTFDLRPKGLDPDTHDIISAILTLDLSDYTGGHGGEHGAHEYASLTAAGHWYGQWEVQGPRSFALNDSLDYLSDYGTLPITLRATGGDFILHGARLVVDAEPQPSSVPAPGSITLLGLGLASCFSIRSRLKGRLCGEHA